MSKYVLMICEGKKVYLLGDYNILSQSTKDMINKIEKNKISYFHYKSGNTNQFIMTSVNEKIQDNKNYQNIILSEEEKYFDKINISDFFAHDFHISHKIKEKFISQSIFIICQLENNMVYRIRQEKCGSILDLYQYDNISQLIDTLLITDIKVSHNIVYTFNHFNHLYITECIQGLEDIHNYVFSIGKY